MGSRRKERCSIATCWRTFKAALALSAVALGVACMVLMPDYRYYAAFLVGQTAVVYFQLWRFTPCDRARVRHIVEKRVEAAVDRVDRRWRRKHKAHHSSKKASSSRHNRHHSASSDALSRESNDNTVSSDDSPDQGAAQNKRSDNDRRKKAAISRDGAAAVSGAAAAHSNHCAATPRRVGSPLRVVRVGSDHRTSVGYGGREPFLDDSVMYCYEGGGDGSIGINNSHWAAVAAGMSSPATAIQRRQHNPTPLLLDPVASPGGRRLVVGSRTATPIHAELQYSPLRWTPSPVRCNQQAAAAGSHSRSPARPIVVRATDSPSFDNDDDDTIAVEGHGNGASPRDDQPHHHRQRSHEVQTPTRRMQRAMHSSAG